MTVYWPLTQTPILPYSSLMTDKLPDSAIVTQLLKALARIERETEDAVKELETLRDSDPKFGYARAAGHASGTLQSIAIIANSYRSTYTNA